MRDGGTAEVRFPCAWCGLEAAAAAETRGRGKCPHCGAWQDVPRTAAAPPGEYALAEEPPTPAEPHPTRPVSPGAETRPVRGFWSGVFHESARRESVLAAEIVALVLLSVADLMTTYHLLRTHPKFYESNPIARLVFARWDVAGMAVYKFSLVAFVVTVGEVVERRRPGLGRFVILTGCVASGLVVAHGLRLAFGEFAGE